MLHLTGGLIVLPDRLLEPGSIVIDGDRILEVREGTIPPAPGQEAVDLHDHVVVPGFVDVHVHGLEGNDALDGTGAIRAIARALPRHGVTAFCPTTAACPPATLARMLAAVRDARTAPDAGAARVLPAHLESNFISPEYRGAQPLDCLRLPPVIRPAGRRRRAAAPRGAATPGAQATADADADFTGADLLDVIVRALPDVGIVTVAPELPGALELIAHLRGRGCLLSLGHSGASLEQARAAIAAGATQATHLFNRMPPLGHREPGLAGAVLESEDLAAEIICDGHHVHPAMIAVTVAAKGPARTLAITDSLAGAGLPAGTRVAFGGRPVTVGDTAAYLDDGTLAGSVLTMEQAFRVLTGRARLGLVSAVHLCSTSPAREMGLTGLGMIVAGATADLVVFDHDLEVSRTYIAGRQVFPQPRP